MARTNQELRIEFKGEILVIPRGTRVTHQTACGFDKKYNFIDEFGWYKPDLTGFARQMAIHDFVHYGINVEPQFVTED